MFLNIITPCSRPENLMKISESIKLSIPKENYRWLVVCDSEELPDKDLIPDNCEIYNYQNESSTYGNGQRNYAIDMVKEGYLYFNDDDTEVHPQLWENVKDLTQDFISFIQLQTDGSTRLLSNSVVLGNIDSHNFIVSNKIVVDSRWIIDYYAADGVFAVECYNKTDNTIWLDRALSVYNTLR